MNHPRIAVVGTGTVGAMTLWRLAARGVPATGFDTYAPGHDRGAAGGESRIFRTAYKEGAEYVPLLHAARELWTELEAAAGRRLLHLVGGATVGPADHPTVRAVLDCATQYGLPVEVLTGEEARRRVPEHPLGDGEVLVLDPNAGFLTPEPAVQAAAAAAERAGATIRRYERVLDVVPDGDGVTIRTAGTTDRFDAVVLAPGPWARTLLADLPVRPRMVTSTWFARRAPELFDPQRCPIAVRVGPHAFSCFPALDGTGVKVNLHGGFPPVESPEDLPRSAAVDLVARLRATVTAVLPGLVPDPIRIATYCDGFTPDEHGLLGPLPGHGGRVHVATGFSGHGFKLAPVFGDAVADLVLTGSTPRPVSHLSPARPL
ncbi:N-methyl-L-tryptophan oxidase [Pseudonocardia sp. DLS-67]